MFSEVQSYWIIPGRLMAGEYPGLGAAEAVRRRVRWLLDNQLDFFMDLTEANEAGLPPYAPILIEESAVSGKVAIHRRMAIPDMDTPEADHMSAILDAIDAALADGRGVYVHCYGGKGRTGTVVGCWQVRHGASGKQALDQIAAWRNALPYGGGESPETEAQRRLVLGWQPGR